ncbi:MAG: cupin domain-containing protein, partial [Chloroflexi bacterium]|nr:cupin domain-containing protein [Chloroflexota bacterium]
MAGTATTRVTGLQSGPGGLMIFRLADLIKHQSSARHWAVVGGQTLTVVYREAAPGAPPVPPHHHPPEQIVLLLEGYNSMVINGVSGRIDPGQLSYVPPNVRHQGGEPAPIFRRYFELFTPPHEQFVEQYQQGAIYSYPDSDPATEDRAHQGPFFRTFSDSWIEKAPGV